MYSLNNCYQKEVTTILILIHFYVHRRELPAVENRPQWHFFPGKRNISIVFSVIFHNKRFSSDCDLELDEISNNVNGPSN